MGGGLLFGFLAKFSGACIQGGHYSRGGLLFGGGGLLQAPLAPAAGLQGGWDAISKSIIPNRLIEMEWEFK